VKKGLLYTILLILVCIRVIGNPIVQLTQEKPYQRIAMQSGWLVDSTARLTLQEFLQTPYQTRLQPATHELGTFGLTDAAIWVQGSFNYTGTDKVYLLVEFANIDSITLFYYDKGQLKTVQSGSHTPLANKTYNFPGYCLEIPFVNNQPQEFWVRIRTGNKVIVPLALATTDGLVNKVKDVNIIALIYAGIVLAMFWYNFSLSTWIRERAAYLYYLGYLFFLAVFILLYLLGLHVYLGESLSRFINQYGIGAVAVSYMFVIRFAISFLDGKKHAPRLTKLLRWGDVLLWGTVICCLMGWRQTTIRLQEMESILFPILFIWMALRAFKQDYKPATFFLIAWLLFLGSIVLFAITNMGWLPFGNWTFYILPIGSAIEVILLSTALGHKYGILEKEKRDQQAKELQSANAQKNLLKQTAEERALALQKALNQLEVNNQAKDKLLNIIAHDIRSPLNNLVGYLELAEKKEVDPGQIQQFIQVLRRQISLIAKSMNNILNWSLTQRNHIETIPTNVLLSPMTRQLLDTYRFSAEEKGVLLKKSMAEEIMVVMDSHQLELVLRNLLDNAIKFTPKGGAITIGCRLKGGKAVVYVADTGEGMLQEAAEELLHRNILYASGGTVQDKGTGLGLQLCREFVASNGSELLVKSAPGEGTEFYFSLPVAG
jgi:signal transduction histidine kinase